MPETVTDAAEATFVEFPTAIVSGLPTLPLHKRSAIYSAGVVYLPASLGGPEVAVARHAARKGAAVVRERRHRYVPAAYLRGHYPHARQAVDLLEGRALDAVRRDAALDAEEPR